MLKLQWFYKHIDVAHYWMAVADNGMMGVLMANTDVFFAPLTFVEMGGLRKISDVVFVDELSAKL